MSRGRKGRAPAPDEGRNRKRSALRRRVINVALIAIIAAGVVAFFMPVKGSYAPGGSGDTIEGLEIFYNRTGHTNSPVVYEQTPPAGGEHHPTWLNCGLYNEQVPNVYAVHAIEHGAVWVTYDPGRLDADGLDTLKDYLPSTYVVLSPFMGLPSPIVLTAWNVQLRIQSPDDPRLPRFFEEYWRNELVPEPGAPCTGGIDGPGRL